MLTWPTAFLLVHALLGSVANRCRLGIRKYPRQGVTWRFTGVPELHGHSTCSQQFESTILLCAAYESPQPLSEAETSGLDLHDEWCNDLPHGMQGMVDGLKEQLSLRGTAQRQPGEGSDMSALPEAQICARVAHQGQPARYSAAQASARAHERSY